MGQGDLDEQLAELEDIAKREHWHDELLDWERRVEALRIAKQSEAITHDIDQPHVRIVTSEEAEELLRNMEVPEHSDQRQDRTDALLQGHLESSAHFQGEIHATMSAMREQVTDLAMQFGRFVERYETDKAMQDERINKNRAKLENGIQERLVAVEQFIHGCSDQYPSRYEFNGALSSIRGKMTLVISLVTILMGGVGGLGAFLIVGAL